MGQQLHESLLMMAPVVVAVAVSLGTPWLHAQGLRAASAPADDYDRTLAQACEASHRAQALPAARGDTAGRTQAPLWQQQHRAAVERCLRDGLKVFRTARAGS